MYHISTILGIQTHQVYFWNKVGYTLLYFKNSFIAVPKNQEMSRLNRDVTLEKWGRVEAYGYPWKDFDRKRVFFTLLYSTSRLFLELQQELTNRVFFAQFAL